VIDAYKKFEYSKDRNAGTKYQQFLKQIPENQKRYKCHTCFSILNAVDVVDGKCGSCGDTMGLVQICVLDHNGCGHNMVPRIEICPICGEVVCPECGDHDALVLSRITGYIGDYSGFNRAKKQEVKDRVHVNLNSNNQMIRANQIT
jgi:hypothetical protein